MKYSETGQFTPEMIKLAKEIRNRIKKLRGLGCILLAKQDSLYAYTVDDIHHADLLMRNSHYPLKNLDCGNIDDAGADDEEYFEEGYITEE